MILQPCNQSSISELRRDNRTCRAWHATCPAHHDAVVHLIRSPHNVRVVQPAEVRFCSMPLAATLKIEI